LTSIHFNETITAYFYKMREIVMINNFTMISRRKLLTRLGAATTAIFIAPALTEMAGEAEAGGHGKGRSSKSGSKRYSSHNKYKRSGRSRSRSSKSSYSRSCNPTPPTPPVDTIPE
jgi:hypothetical protein